MPEPQSARSNVDDEFDINEFPPLPPLTPASSRALSEIHTYPQYLSQCKARYGLRVYNELDAHLLRHVNRNPNIFFDCDTLTANETARYGDGQLRMSEVHWYDVAWRRWRNEIFNIPYNAREVLWQVRSGLAPPAAGGKPRARTVDLSEVDDE